MLDWLDHELMVQRSIYTGFYSGLYTSSRKNQVPKPTPECMGSWIVDDMKEIDHFWVQLFHDFWSVNSHELQQIWYSTGDLMFKNDDYCHFRQVIQDVIAYCKITEDPKQKKKSLKDEPNFDIQFDDISEPVAANCAPIKLLGNLQKNVFNLVTQGSSLMANFHQEGWEDLSDEDKAYTFQQLGHSLGTMLVAITGFKPTITF